MQVPGALFKPNLEKMKKNLLEKKKLIFREMQLSGSNI